jgi:hypothetical protein
MKEHAAKGTGDQKEYIKNNERERKYKCWRDVRPKTNAQLLLKPKHDKMKGREK